MVKGNEATWGNLGYAASPNGTVISLVYKAPTNGVDAVEGKWLFFEEFCAVSVLLVGLLHLIHDNSPDLLANSYWKNGTTENNRNAVDGEKSNANPTWGFRTEMDSVLSSINVLLGKSSTIVTELGILKKAVSKISPASTVRLSEMKQLPAPPIQIPPSKKKEESTPNNEIEPDIQERKGAGITPGTGLALSWHQERMNTKSLIFLRSANEAVNRKSAASEEEEEDQSPPPPTEEKEPWVQKPSPPYTPVPAQLIIQASLLVAAVSRAFPSAHQSLHLSLYIWWMGGSGKSFVSKT